METWKVVQISLVVVGQGTLVVCRREITYRTVTYTLGERTVSTSFPPTSSHSFRFVSFLNVFSLPVVTLSLHNLQRDFQISSDSPKCLFCQHCVYCSVLDWLFDFCSIKFIFAMYTT